MSDFKKEEAIRSGEEQTDPNGHLVIGDACLPL